MILCFSIALYLYHKRNRVKSKKNIPDLFFIATEESPASIIIADKDCNIIYVNKQFETMSGYSKDEVIGKKTNILNSGLTIESVYNELWETINNNKIWNGEFINRRKDGQLYWESASIVSILNKKDNAPLYIGVKFDITQKKSLEYHNHSYKQAFELFSTGADLKEIIDSILFGLEEKTPGSIVCSVLLSDNENNYLKLLSAPSMPDFYKNAINNIQISEGITSFGTAAYTRNRIIISDIAEIPHQAPHKKLALHAGLRSCWSEPIYGKNNELLAVLSIYHRKIYTPTEEELSSVNKYLQLISLAIERYRTIDILRRNEEYYRQLAHYDPLTSLANNLTFTEQIEHEITLSIKKGRKLAIMFIDLNKFKDINDHFGHTVGDLLLKEVASRMRHAVRDTDKVYRRSGDEFIILLQGIKEKNNTLYIAKKIHNSLKNPFYFEGHKISISCSIGISIYPDHGNNSLTLVINADSAMYQAKAMGAAKTVIHTSAINL
ncbi:TPA: diguanylate cyclase [Morganella morganii]|uniref:Diguanylate cyclase n=2 Tax=Bacteria TaxID=2 RepID=A0AAU6TZW9_UNCXX|nr:diguanylate cyclase [Morganella morganii]HCC5750003.1 diguanylate cyclase [Morganella morganii]